jgi:hypothetical protein
MAIRRVSTEKRRRHTGYQTAMGLYTQDGREPTQVFAERHVSVFTLNAYRSYILMSGFCMQ